MPQPRKRIFFELEGRAYALLVAFLPGTSAMLSVDYALHGCSVVVRCGVKLDGRLWAAFAYLLLEDTDIAIVVSTAL